MSQRLTVLIVGGYGTFGGRLVTLLEQRTDLNLIVAGRSLQRAQAFCRAHPGTLTPMAFDRDGDLDAQLADSAPDVVIDASGPFQSYGADGYRLIEACLARRIRYLDLADGADFVAGVGRFDAAAKAAGVFILSGVSSFPVLTAAVVRRLADGMAHIDQIRAGIAPSPYAGVGENVIRAIASYSGKPVPLRRDGRSGVGYPLTEQMRYVVAPPGRLPLRDTLFSLVDVPDLRALAELWPDCRTVWMGAGPVPEIWHRCLIGLAWLVRWRLLPSLSPFARLMHWATNHLRWGEHRGGMFVEVSGRDAAGATRVRSWHMLAEGDDGPFIPSMAAQAILARMQSGRPPPPGARAAVGDLELEDYENLFAPREIHTGLLGDDGGGLYRRLLGDAWDTLPAPLRALHEADVAEGEASVERGEGWLARLVGDIVGFPKTTPAVPVRVDFVRAEGRETWTRRFGRETFHSEQYEGAGRSRRLLVERFGPFAFSLALVVEDAKLWLKPRRWGLWGVPLPMALCPNVRAYESGEDGRFGFHVEIAAPLIGLIVRYRGSLTPVAAPKAPALPQNGTLAPASL